MTRSQLDVISHWVEPWRAPPEAFFAAVQNVLPFERSAVGVLTLERPQADEVLQSRGIAAEEWALWLSQGFASDPVFQAVRRAGHSKVEAGGPERTPLAPGMHATMHLLAESAEPRRAWWLLLARRGEPFAEAEKQESELMLRQWQACFSQPDEKGMGRLLLGHDQRLLAADLNTQARMLREPALHRELLGALGQVIAQRYGALTDSAAADLELADEGQGWWVSVRHGPGAGADSNGYSYLELRPLEENELPAVGLLPDQRIAQALAYIHANYQQAPGLSEVAKAVHVSPFHFHRLFRALVGISPKQYMQRKQLQVAKWLLRQSHEPVGAVAARTGFSSHGHFTSTFHRMVGLSPTEYREKRGK